MNRILHITIYLIVGFIVGLSFDNFMILLNQQERDISEIEFYDNIVRSVETVKIYETSEITEEIINNRAGKIVVEKVIGKVTNYKLDGEILNCSNKQNYITYQNVEGAKEGDKIITYFIYNPFTNIQDDVVIRLDFIIDDNII